MTVHCAAWRGDVESLAKEVMNVGGANASDSHGLTSLHLAVWNVHVPVVEALAKSGIDFNAKDKHGRTALHLAVWNDDVPMIKTLLDAGADITACDSSGWSPMHWAAANGGVDEIFPAGVGPTLIIDDSRSVMHVAVLSQYEVVRTIELLKMEGADPSAKDIYGSTPMQLAAMHGGEEIINALSEAGTDVSLMNNEGHTALRVAAIHGNDGVIKGLVQAGADVNEQDDLRETALHSAVSGCHSIISGLKSEARGEVWKEARLNVLERYTKVIEVLVDEGANLSKTDIAGLTSLHFAEEYGHIEIIRALKEFGHKPAIMRAEPNIRPLEWKRRF